MPNVPKEALFKIWMIAFMFTTMFVGVILRVGHII